MDLETLTAAMRDFVQSKGWIDDSSAKPQSHRNLAISLVLEASEVLEHFQWGEECADPEALAEELADVMLYLLQLAEINGVDLGEEVMKKLAKNRERDWPAPAAGDADRKAKLD
ncbi:MAG: nucleotide pyrophosphohydrolase [Chloroflexi bacterium]|nr:nucleotide pyrophosphohydrolase [Chloroflexota bacterium]